MLHEANSLDFTSVYRSLQLVDVKEILYLKEESMYLSTEFSFLFCILSDLLIRGNAIKKGGGMKSSFVLALGLNKRDDFVAGVRNQRPGSMEFQKDWSSHLPSNKRGRQGSI